MKNTQWKTIMLHHGNQWYRILTISMPVDGVAHGASSPETEQSYKITVRYLSISIPVHGIEHWHLVQRKSKHIKLPYDTSLLALQ